MKSYPIYDLQWKSIDVCFPMKNTYGFLSSSTDSYQATCQSDQILPFVMKSDRFAILSENMKKVWVW